MRGGDVRTGELFSYVDLEDRVRRDHPLRAIRLIVNDALVSLEWDFSALYSPIGRPSIAPEKLLRAMMLQAFYSIRSERLLMERLEYDLLFRWFVGIGIDDAAWDHSVFSKNRDRLLEGDIAAKFLSAILSQPKVKRLLSTDHFSFDGTLIEAWASMKSVKPKDGSGAPPAGGSGRNAEADFHGEKRSNETHASTTDPDARLYRKGKGKETKLCFMGHGLMENRHGLLVDACLTEAGGHAERIAALHMIEPRVDRPQAITLGADGHGEIAFGALQAGLDLGYSQNLVHFTWAGFDEMDEVSGDGHAELLDDGTIEITFAYHHGDEAVLKAKRETSSTAC
jgi:transposase